MTTATNTVTFKVKSVYGNDMYYPTCPVGIALCTLNGTKTLTMAIERIAPALGFIINKIG